MKPFFFLLCSFFSEQHDEKEKVGYEVKPLTPDYWQSHDAMVENDYFCKVSDERLSSFLSLGDVEMSPFFLNAMATTAAAADSIGQPKQDMESQVVANENNNPPDASLYGIDSMGNERSSICALSHSNHFNIVNSAICKNNGIPSSCGKKLASSLQKVHLGAQNEALNLVYNQITVALYVRSLEPVCRSHQLVHVNKPWPIKRQRRSPHRLKRAKARVEAAQLASHSVLNSQSVLDGCSRGTRTLPIPLQVYSAIKTAFSGSAHPKEVSQKTKPVAGKSCATQGETGGGTPSSSTGQPACRNNGQSSNTPFAPGERNHPLSDRSNSGARVEEVDSFQDATVVLVVQADVNRITIKNGEPDGSGELVFTPPKLVDPGGKSELVRCADYSTNVQVPLPHGMSYLKANVHTSSDAHQNSCNRLVSDASSPPKTIHSAPLLEEGDTNLQYLSIAKEVANYSAFGSSLVASEPPACSLLSQPKSNVCPLTTSHSISVASTAIESDDEALYWIEANTEIVSGCVCLLVTMNSDLPFQNEESSLSVSAEPPVHMDEEVTYWMDPESESAITSFDLWGATSEPVYPLLV